MLPLLLLAGLLLTTSGEPPPRERDRAVTLLAVGDIQLARGVGRMIAQAGPDAPFRDVRDLVRAADLAIFNLECALSKDGIPIQKRYSFKADPTAAEGLARAGFDVAVLANNHSVDCGRWALPETMSVLRAHGIETVGAGRTMTEANGALIVERSGLRLAFLARTFVLPDGVIYREDVPTIAIYDPARIEAEVRAAACEADLVVVSLHWGVEYARQPQESQRRIARRLVDAGADVVIGHHPHTPQPVEVYRGALIAYSLGNFVFDSRGEGGARGLILRGTFTPGGMQDWGALPVVIDDGRPRPVEEAR